MSNSKFPSSLLPTNSLAIEHALDSLAERQLNFDLSNVDLHPKTCPATLLPLLAAQWRVDISNMTEDQQRTFITNALEIHRYKGTVYAVKKALASVFSDSDLIEFDANTQADYVFEFDAQVKTNAEPDAIYDATQFELAKRLINKAKNARSRLRHFKLSLPEANSHTYVGCAGIFSRRLKQDLAIKAAQPLYLTTSVKWELILDAK